MEDNASWISRAFMHLEALCMPETPFPDDYNANESTRHLLLPRPRLRFAQFCLHRELTLQIPRNYRELEASKVCCVQEPESWGTSQSHKDVCHALASIQETS
jgi:hypothetical protein